MSGGKHLLLLYAFVYLTRTYLHVFTKVKFVSMDRILTEISVRSLAVCKGKIHTRTGHEDPEVGVDV